MFTDVKRIAACAAFVAALFVPPAICRAVTIPTPGCLTGHYGLFTQCGATVDPFSNRLEQQLHLGLRAGERCHATGNVEIRTDSLRIRAGGPVGTIAAFLLKRSRSRALVIERECVRLTGP